LKVFRRLIVEEVEPDDSVVEWVTVRPIDPEDLRATGSFLEIGDVVFGKLLAQVEADHIEFGYVAHVPCVHPSGIVCSKSQEDRCSLRCSRYVPGDTVYAIDLCKVMRPDRVFCTSSRFEEYRPKR